MAAATAKGAVQRISAACIAPFGYVIFVAATFVSWCSLVIKPFWQRISAACFAPSFKARRYLARAMLRCARGIMGAICAPFHFLVWAMLSVAASLVSAAVFSALQVACMSITALLAVVNSPLGYAVGLPSWAADEPRMGSTSPPVVCSGDNHVVCSSHRDSFCGQEVHYDL